MKNISHIETKWGNFTYEIHYEILEEALDAIYSGNHYSWT